MPEAYIIDAVRTPRGIGKVGKGALANVHPQHLAAMVLKALQTAATVSSRVRARRDGKHGRLPDADAERTRAGG